ncbi:uncharacterized protein LOC135486907 [Lineus longissimus]|uniref:uncharacterized protein LOC135486907 n=1 Tax=Lineus longissimus TaxID=88925 RepID=UPI002B4F39F6
MNHEIHRARDRLQTLTPIIEEKSFFSLESLRTPSPGNGASSPDKAKGKNVRLPPIEDTENDDPPRLPRPSRMPSELDSLISGYLSQTVNPKPTAFIGYDPTLYCKCCEPINNVSQIRLKEFSSGFLSPAEEPDAFGHYKAKDKPKIGSTSAGEQRRDANAGGNRASFGPSDAKTLMERQRTYYNDNNAHAHQPFHVAIPDHQPQAQYLNSDIQRYVHNPRIYVDTSKAHVPSSFRMERKFPQPETPPFDQRRSDLQSMNTVMDAASKYDNSMQALEGTIKNLRSGRKVIIDEMENTYRHFDKFSGSII